MNYSCTGEQLTAIADAIRAKAHIANGKNILNPTTLKAYVNLTQATKFTMSGDFTLQSGESSSSVTISLVGVYETIIFTISGSGTVHGYDTFTAPAGTIRMDVSFGSEITAYENLQIEQGQTETSYEPFDDKIVFPTEYVSNIGDLTYTKDANATAGDILEGKTAYVNGSLIWGGYVPLDTSDATATASDIKSGFTAYANNVKVTGGYTPSLSYVDALTGTIEITPTSLTRIRTSSTAWWNLVAHPIPAPNGTNLKICKFTSGTIKESGASSPVTLSSDTLDNFKGNLKYENSVGKLQLKTKSTEFVIPANATLVLNFTYCDYTIT